MNTQESISNNPEIRSLTEGELEAVNGGLLLGILIIANLGIHSLNAAAGVYDGIGGAIVADANPY